MGQVSSFLIGIGITLACSLGVVVYLRPHLRRVLVEFCGTDERADFWTAFSVVTLVLVPVIGSLFPHPEGGSATSAFFDVSAQLKWGLIGLVVAVVVLGFVIGRFVPRTPLSK